MKCHARIVFRCANGRMNNGRFEMNHDPLQWLVTRVMCYGKLGLLLALMLCKDRVSLVCEHTRAWPLLCSPFMFNVRHRTWFDKLIKQLLKRLAIPLVKQLAIPLGCQRTTTKWLVISRQKTTSKSLVITTDGINPRFSNPGQP
jgi:hypothetical protein